MNPDFSAVVVFSTNASVTFTMPLVQVCFDVADLRLPFLPMLGTGWAQSITEGIRQAITRYADRKYILFYDGDGFWRKQDLIEMYRRIDSDPTMDAIFPCQSSRTCDRPLAYDYRTPDYDGPPLTYDSPMQECQHGHFAGTLIRMEVFRRLSEPWLCAIPSPSDGSWDSTEGAMDADTFFWLKLWKFNQLARNGHRIVQANDILVGHGQYMIRWPNGVKTTYQGLQDWFTTKTPPIESHCPTMAEARTSVAAEFANV
jgi:hypothetical protein